MNCEATTDLTTLTPQEIDTLWAAVLARLAPLQSALNETLSSIRKYERARWPENRYGYLLARRAQQQAAVAEVATELKPFQAEWDRRGGWERYEVCPGGHVHQMRPQCHTLRPGRTLVVLLPELTGKSEREVVDQVGHVACTHCFPWAPTVPAFQQSAAEQAAVETAKQELRCPASGDYATGAGRRRSITCPTCGRQRVSLTTTGKLRAHDRPKSE